jgi:hypothetical protein
MALPDMLRFTLAYLLVVMAPGYALAALARPRAAHSERLALAIPCGYTLVALSGLATALMHLPFNLTAYAVPAVPATLAGGYAAWRSRGQRMDDQRRWWLVPVGVALAQLGAIALMYAGHVVPVSADVTTHVQWTDLIARAHVFPIALLSSHLGTDTGGFYPPAFHALNYLILTVVPMATYRVVFFSMVATVALLPLALYTYVRMVTGSAKLGALAALAALTFEPLPLFAMAEGFYTFVVSALFVPALTLALRDGLGSRDRRAVALAAALGVGLFYTHPTEFVTVVLLALVFVPGLLRAPRAWATAMGYGLVVGATWLLAALPALAAVHRTIAGGAQAEIQGAHYFASPPHLDLAPLLPIYTQWIFGRNVSYLLLAAVVAGFVYCLARRRYLGLVAAQLILFLVALDANSYNVLQRLYALSFPWALWERLAPTHYWVILPLAALGIDRVLVPGRRLLCRKSSAFAALVAIPLVLLGLALPFGVATARVAAYVDARKVVAPSDLGALAWLSRHASADSVAATDGDLVHQNVFDIPIDAGLWMPMLGGTQPLFTRWGTGPGTADDRLYALQHITDNPLPPRAALFVRRYHVHYVFYGAVVRPGASRHLSLVRLLADPRLRLVYSSNSTCRTEGSYTPVQCPPTATYLFGITATDQTANRKA